MPPNPMTCTIPLGEDGAHHGVLRLPHSHDASAWGNVMSPITVIRNGHGPTALLTGANHGDEYEGPIALQSLSATLRPDQIRGRVIIVPYMNTPAFRAGTRTSPFDGGNLNRSFPGAPQGGVTAQIADYFTTVLAPLADIVLDFHSGGRSLDFLPFAAAHRLDDPAQEAACVAAMRAFNAPWSVILREIDPEAMFDTAVERMGKTFVTTELGGGGTATVRSVGIAKRGVRNLLIHAGILPGEPAWTPSPLLDMPGADCFTFAEDDGLLEPLADLGETIARDQPLACIWPAHRSGMQPTTYRARRDGLLVGRHFPGLIHPGDCLAVLAVPNEIAAT